MRPERLLIAAVALCLVFSTAAGAQPNPPTDSEIAQAIARGVAFLEECQSEQGSWTDPAQSQHTLGTTALAALALLENGVSPDSRSIARATHSVVELAESSNQTYDLALATLLLARVGSAERGEHDALIKSLGRRLAAGGRDGIWSYTVPRDEGDHASGRREEARREGRRGLRRAPIFFPGPGDNSNTQFALLGLWAAGRHGFGADPALASIDHHFRSTQHEDGHWGYRPGAESRDSMTCAGLMALAITASRSSLAERQTARARGAALAADPLFLAALNAVQEDARPAHRQIEIYYLWSLERVCVALGLRSLGGVDWYGQGAGVLLARQRTDGSWADSWGTLPATSFALLFLRKANLAFEIDRVLRLPEMEGNRRVVRTSAPSEPEGGASEPDQDQGDTAAPSPGDDHAPAEPGSGDVRVNVTGASEKSFPQISVQFEVKRSDGSFVRDARRDDFHVTEEGRDVPIVEFQAPLATEAIPTTVVLVVDRSRSMENENRIGGLKRAVGSFLEKLPEGSRVALIAFGSDVNLLTSFTTDRERVRTAVNALEPSGATRFYDAVASALELLEPETGRRAVLALTDGEDTDSHSASLDSAIATAKQIGMPIYTLGLGSEDEIESADLRRLARSTRGQYYPAKSADQLRAIYEQIAERLGASYSLVYQSDRKIADGTLRPVRIVYRASAATAGETAVFIPGMVVPAGGWSPLFLALLGGLTFLFILPGQLARRRAGAPGTALHEPHKAAQQ
jgi:VWFA-related protein